MKLFAFHFCTDALTKGMNPSQQWVNSRADLVWQAIYKKNSGFKLAVLCLKIDLLSYPAHGGAVW